LLRFSFILALTAASTFAGSFSFTGTFTQDDDLQSFFFSISSNTTITLRTYGYAGGTNFAGTNIARGGFDPILSLFDNAGNLINVNNDGGCGVVNQDSVTGACWDSYISTSLPAGLYRAVLSQSDNSANGPTLADGFQRAGQGNFTGPAFIGSEGSFIDANPSQRNGNWAVDLLNVDRAAVSPLTDVPEPSTWLLVSSSLAFVAAKRIRRG
jgi:hypothetical protein